MAFLPSDLGALTLLLAAVSVVSAESQAIWTCDFEAGECGLVPSPIGPRWVIKNLAAAGGDGTQVPLSGIPVTGQNQVLYLPLYSVGEFNADMGSVSVSSTQTLAGKTESNPIGEFCFSYWIYMASDKLNTFRVATTGTDGEHAVVQNLEGNAAPTWRRHQIYFRRSNPFQLQFMGNTVPKSTNHFSEVALDVMVLYEGSCSKLEGRGDQISCDFEESFCGYFVSGDWVRVSFDTAQSVISTGNVGLPAHDTTYHSSQGNYAIVKFPSAPVGTPSREFVMSSPTEPVINSSCISLYYQVRKSGLGWAPSLNVDTYLDGNRGSLFSSSLSNGNTWVFVEKQFDNPSPGVRGNLRLEFAATAIATSSGVIAVDDVRITDGICEKKGDCDFNTATRDYCAWQSITEPPYNMVWVRGNVPNGPGPSLDGYIYFFGGRGSGNFVRSRALLLSEEMEHSEAKCMSFRFFMNVTDIAAIRIHAVESEDEDKVIWEHLGGPGHGDVDMGNGWRLARVPLPIMNLADFMIKIEGVILRETSYRYMVAVDSVHFLQTTCEVTPSGAVPNPTVEPPVPHASHVCDFDIDDCEFIADETAPAYFRLRKGETLDDYTESAPQYDHTTLEDVGRYLYFAPEAGAKAGQFARMISPVYTRTNPSDPRCLRPQIVVSCDQSTRISGEAVLYQTSRIAQGKPILYDSTLEERLSCAENRLFCYTSKRVEWDDYLWTTEQYLPEELFWYNYHSGYEGGRLTMYVNMSANNQEQELWSTVNAPTYYTNGWRLGIATVPASLNFTIVFEGYVLKDGARVSIALDDISVEQNECRHLDCDFEEGMCNWANADYAAAGGDDLVWEFANAPLLPPGVIDSSSDRGLFLYVPVRNSTPAGHQAILEHLEIIQTSTRTCLTFDYLITFSKNVGRLSLMRHKEGDFTEDTWPILVDIWDSDLASQQYGRWSQGQLPIHVDKPWTLVFVVSANPNDVNLPNELNVIALDNIRHRIMTDSESDCPTRPANAAPPTIVPPPTSAPSDNGVVQFCNFEENLCSFEPGPDSTVIWQRLAAENNNDAWFFEDRPGAQKGNKFLFLSFYNPDWELKYGQLIYRSSFMNSVPETPPEYCLRFWISMHSTRADKFTINALRADHTGGALSPKVLATFTGNDANDWVLRHIDFTYTGPFEISFDAVIQPDAHESHTGVAIDDYTLEVGKCSNNDGPHQASDRCDFEEDDCGYVNVGAIDHMAWKRTSRVEQTDFSDLFLMNVLPEVDNTYASSSGHFAMAYMGPKMNTDFPQGRQKTKYQSPSYAFTGDQCVSFYYRLLKHGNDGPQLELEVAADGKDRSLWKSETPHGKKWIAMKKPILSRGLSSPFNATLRFVASAMKGAQGAVAVDDVVVTPGACTHAGDCIFNTGNGGLCTWTRFQSEQTSLQWINGMPKDGPPADSGYIYVEGGRNSGNYPGMRAVLYSENLQMPPSGCLCMTFQYYFNSSGAAVVRIHVVEDPAEYNPVWTAKGIEVANTTFGGNGWLNAQVPILAQNPRDFLVTIEAHLLREVDVDYFMAIEDVVFLEQTCALTPTNALPLPTVAPPEGDTADVCTFDDDVQVEPMCGWKLDPSSTAAKWQLLTGRDNARDENVPRFDHSLVEPIGHFVYFNFTNLPTNTKGSIISAEYARDKPTDPRCLRFWFHGKGSNLGEILVHLTSGGTVTDLEQLLYISAYDTFYWHQRTINLPLELMKFNLVFEGVSLFDNGVGGIAIDDVSVSHGECAQIDCNFEHGMCSWENYHANDGSKSPLEFEFGTRNILESDDDSAERGVFLYVPIPFGTPAGQLAYLRHDSLVESDQPFCLHFEYLTTSDYVGRLTVWYYWLNATTWAYETEQVWTSRGENKIKEWQSGQIYLGRGEWWTIMLGVTANEENGDIPFGVQGIAIDNIKKEEVKNADFCPTLPRGADVTTVLPVATTTPNTSPHSNNEVLQYCDFNQDWCGFAPLPGSRLVWHRTNQDEHDITDAWWIPERTKDSEDKFLFADLWAPSAGFREGSVISPVVTTGTTEHYCLRYWVFMDAAANDRFEVILHKVPSKQDVVLETYKGPARTDWTFEAVSFDSQLLSLPTAQSFQIMLKASTNGHVSELSAIAIDEYILEAGKCSDDGYPAAGIQCDFEEDECHYTSDMDSVYWYRTNRLDLTSSADIMEMELKPTEDNTYHSVEGHYAYVYFGTKLDDIPSGPSNAKKTSITSPEYKLSGDQCISFFYRNQALPNKPGGKLAVAYIAEGKRTEMWNSVVAHGKNWIFVKKSFSSRTLSANYTLKVQFTGSGERGARAGLALDDISIMPGDCLEPGDCTFNSAVKLCGWTHVDSEDYRMEWLRGMPKDGPSTESSYIYFHGGRPTGFPVRTRARLVSEDLEYPANGIMCMLFSFFSNSSGAAAVRIHQGERVNDYNPLWENRGLEVANTTLGGTGWHSAKVPIPRPPQGNDFLIMVEGVILREVNVRYMMAVEDIVFLRGSDDCALSPSDSIPQPHVTPPDEDETAEICTFDDRILEEPLCGWEPDKSTPLQWEILTGVDRVNDDNVPPFDHTTLEDYGHFLYFNSTGQRPGNAARIISTPYTRDKPGQPRCARFWYYVTGNDMGALNVYVQEKNRTLLFGMPYAWPTGRWFSASEEIPLDYMSFTLVFEGLSTTEVGEGGVAIDDIAVLPHECRQIDCNFEHGMCQWENYYDESGNLEAEFEYGTAAILPSNDDSFERGFFLYVPVHNTTQPRELAYLRHDSFIEGGQNYCVHFEYRVTVRNAGRLTIWFYWVENNAYPHPKEVWRSFGGDKINEWQSGQIFINQSTYWTLMFEVLVNEYGRPLPAGLHGVALDNIKMEVVPDAEHCPTLPDDAAPTTPAPPTTASTSSTAAPQPTFDCEFEVGHLCGWTQKADTAFKWSQGRKLSTGNEAGPVMGDHSRTGDGYFAYINAPAGKEGDKARLYSPSLNMKVPYCVRFFYNMHGDGMGQINMFYVNKGSTFNPSWNPPFTVYGRNYGDQWLGAAYTIGINSEKQIVIEAVRGSSATSYIAIDSISVTSGTCEGAGYCNFNNNWCKFNAFPLPASSFWEISAPAAPVATAGYAAMASHPSINSQSMMFRSDILPANQRWCLYFDFIVTPGSTLRLTVTEFPAETNPQHITRTIWSVDGALSLDIFSWTEGRVSLTSTNQNPNPIQVSFEASFAEGSGPGNSVSVDNVEVDTKASCSILPWQAVVGPTTTATTLDYTVETMIPPTDPPVQNALSLYGCNFDLNTFCLWTSTGPIDWKLANNQIDPQSGPTTDHYGYGYYAYFDPSSFWDFVSNRQTGKLESPVISWPASSTEEQPSFYVMHFWYYLHGAGIDELRVLRQYSGSDVWATLWSARDDQGKRWIPGQAFITVDQRTFKVAFEGRRKTGLDALRAAYIAVDEVMFMYGKDSDPLSDSVCDFDTSSWCQYQTHSTTGVSWTWRNGETTTELNDTGPLIDKSQNSAYGHYMAFDSKDIPVGQSARLISTHHNATSDACLKFYYYKRSRTAHPELLQVDLAKNDDINQLTEPLWSDDDMIGGDFWEPVFIQIQSPDTPWKIVWEAMVVSVDQPIVAIDHVVVTEGVCPGNLLQCGFDEDLCEWSDDKASDHVDWVWTSGYDEIQGTGPMTGDAQGDLDGGYLLFEANSADIGETARLISTPVKNDGRPASCFRFYYHMFGIGIGELTIFQRNLETDEETIIWYLSGSQSEQWLDGRVRLAGDFPYQIVIEAQKRGNSGLGDIAIDEFDEDDSDCPISPPQAASTPFPATTLASTTASSAAKSLNCTFERDTCAWIIEDSRVKWERVLAYTQPSYGSGPGVDHPGDDMGHYMVFNAFLANANESARFSSPVLDGQKCVMFYYHAAGEHVGQLNVVLKPLEAGEETRWSRSSPDDGYLWLSGEVEMQSDSAYQIVFEAVHGEGRRGDIAVDDISVNDGPCYDQSGLCTFQSGMCGFTHGPDPNAMIWQRIRTKWSLTNPPSFAPSVDTTLGTLYGWYLMANRHDTANASVAEIQSPVFPATPNSIPEGASQCLKFFYTFSAMKNVTERLLVTELRGGISTELLTVTGNQGSVWHRASINVPSVFPFSILFRAELSDKYTVAAIDDVSVSMGECTHFIDCSFGSDLLCNWENVDENDGLDDFDWIAASPNQGLTNGPPHDHTENQTGWFALASGDAPVRAGDRAWLVSPEIPSNQYICISFWYYINEFEGLMSQLTLKSVDFSDNGTKDYWRINSGSGGEWYQGQVGSSAPWRHRLVFEAVIVNHRKAAVAIDDIKFIDHQCDPDIIPETADPNYVPPTTTPSPHGDFEFNCTFESGTFCGWKNSDSNVEACTWKLQSGPSNSTVTGPPSDHTHENPDGHYLYFQSRYCNAPSFTSIEMVNSVSGFHQPKQCFRFWYYMYGAPVGLVLTLASDSGDEWFQFTRLGNQGRQWIQAEVTLEGMPNSPYKLRFSAPPGPVVSGDIALDDFDFTDGECQSSIGLVDFEGSHFMGFRPVSGGTPGFQWKPVAAHDVAADAYDHTLLTNYGRLAFADGTSVPKNARAYLVSPPYTYNPDSPQCLSFWYQITSSDTSDPSGGTLSLNLLRASQSNDFTSPDWSISGANFLTNMWEYATIPVAIREDFKFGFDARNGNKFMFMLDDIRVLDEDCAEPLSCNFEDDFCGWSNTPSWLGGASDSKPPDHIDWIRSRADANPSDNAGPSVDATYGHTEGYYIFIDNEYPNVDADAEADLYSERVRSGVDEQWCFSFWYHMYIDSRSNASLELMVRTAGEVQDSLFYKNDPGRNQWVRENVTIAVGTDFMLIFQGKVHGQKGKSDIALDEFSARRGVCVETVYPDFNCGASTSVNGPFIPHEKVCDQRNDCSSGADEKYCGDCAFDFNAQNPLCDYTTVDNDDGFRWTLTENHLPPHPDSGALGTAGYMNADLNGGVARSVAFLDSPHIHQTSATCRITFYAHVFSDSGDPGALIVTIRMKNVDTSIAIVDKIMLDVDGHSYWQKFDVQVGRQYGDFQFVFRARRGSVGNGSIALDEIKFEDCTFPAAQTSCPANLWQCPQGKGCIDLARKRCDFTDDCGYYEDESKCELTHPERCDFDTDLCQWKQATYDSFDWVRTTSRTPTGYTGPLRDHTTGLRNGGFIHISSSSSPTDVGKSARILGPILNVASNQCFVRFHYHMFGAETGVLRVFHRSGVAGETKLFEKSGDQGDRWINDQAQIPMGINGQVIFDATIGGQRGDIALDDISFSSACFGLPDLPADITTSSATTSTPTTSPATPTTTRAATTSTSTRTTTSTPTSASRPTSTSTAQTTTPSTSISTPTTTPTTTTASTTPKPIVPVSSSTVPSSSTKTSVLEDCPTSFCAPSKTCLTQSQVCDGKNDCDNEFDEKNCQKTAPGPGPTSGGGLGGGAIAGIVIGVLAGVAGLLGGTYGLMMWRRKRMGASAAGNTRTNYLSFGALNGGSDEMDTDNDTGGNRVLHDMFSKDL